MRRMLLAAAFAASPGLALAQPPNIGSVHEFYDPVFASTVVCDTLAQLEEIAGADEPNQVFLAFFHDQNARHEPVCAAIFPTGEVLEVVKLGVMTSGELTFNAWAVKTEFSGITGYALYLEQFELIYA